MLLDAEMTLNKSCSYPYDRDDADITLRSSNDTLFKVHRIILVMASPVFADMFSLPQPLTQSATREQPVVDLTENGKTLRALLDTCYPVAIANLSDLDIVHSTLQAAIKYDMPKSISLAKHALRRFVLKEPLRVYAIACKLNLEQLAKAAAAQELAVCSRKQGYVKELNEISAGCYHRLLQYCKKRDDWEALVFCTSKHGTGSVDQEDGGGKESDTSILNHPSDSIIAAAPFDSLAASAEIITSDGVRFLVDKSFVAMASPPLADRLAPVETEDSPSQPDAESPPRSPDLTSGSSPRVSVVIEEDSKLLDILLRLCHPSCLPEIPENLTVVAQLSEAAHRYQMEKVIKFLHVLWVRYVPLNPFRAFLLAASHGWTTQARYAARALLRETIDTLEDNYLPEMESIPARMYYHLLTYHKQCGQAILASDRSWKARLSNEIQQGIRCNSSYCGSYGSDAPRWVTPAITRLTDWLVERPYAGSSTNNPMLATVLQTAIKEKCSSCPGPDKLIPHVMAFYHSFVSFTQAIIDKVSRPPLHNTVLISEYPFSFIRLNVTSHDGSLATVDFIESPIKEARHRVDPVLM